MSYKTRKSFPINNKAKLKVDRTSSLNLTSYDSRFLYRAWDCVNGTLVKEFMIPPTFMNFSQFWAIYDNSTVELDRMQKIMPIEQRLTIYNKSKLFINLEGCVNTLRNECKDFHRTHGRNGSDHSAHSQFPCFYNMVRF